MNSFLNNIKSYILTFSGILLISITISCNNNNTKTTKYTEIEPVASTFVGGSSCKTCHESEYNSWKDSHHDQAMKLADSVSILANFNNTKFTHKGVTSKFYKKDGDFYVNTQGEDGKYHEYKIIYTFGFTPLQQYIVKFPDGKYQCLLTAWDSVKNKWFHLQPKLDIHHEEWMNWTGGSQNWNTMCADCHSTNLHKNFDGETDIYKTTFDEINVNCEACHGPSSEHVAFYEKEDQTGTPPKMHMETGMDSKELVQKCARCHSRRAQITDFYDYKGHFLDHYDPQLLTSPTYFEDGQILDEDYVYASFVQSKMYSLGVSCRDCHDVHSMKLKKDGNDLCLTCHVPANYNTPKHHFHKENTEASQCINCHMTGRIYMGNDFRRDHSFRIPRPDQSEKYGTPNACNGCHTDKSAKWAADFVIEKYGDERADHFSDHLLKGYHENKDGFKDVFSNENYPEIARATAINQYVNRAITEEDVVNLLSYLKDPSILVRTETVRALEKTQLPNYSNNVMPLLQDSLRIVRIAAARYFNMAKIDMSTNEDFKKANKEYLNQLDLNLDFASGHHQKALYYQAKNNTEAAIKSYEKAIKIDSYYNMSRMNLALLYYQLGEPKKSEKLYLKVIEQEPDFALSYYMLGLLYNELGDNENSLKYLKLSSEREPASVNSFYNYALKLQGIKDYKESILVLNKGLKEFPNDERLLHIKAIALVNLNKLSEAYQIAVDLTKINPNNPNYQQLLQNIQVTIQNN
ncbi:Tetratricopeptide (TPR) repeat [Lutibacter oricola]|uniref:Tetratricopeptide (TPR) repeat n=1 Tax=Lutibacter oricola TaxID=762486 RepID=A0A1H2UB23_9FLAO|nr:multiheme c-type cytochrome [Lutibacter oricola]SDW53371.1 Tetratricopeptide (TPR) repeat [Lutibacter oricola]